MKYLQQLSVAALATLVIGCGHSPDQSHTPTSITGPSVTPEPESGETLAGKAFDTTLTSELDGEAIAISFFEPTEITGGQTYPLIMNSHGFGGSRQKANSTDGFIQRLRDAGYAVLTLDQRGHGESGGQIEALNPEKEGHDMFQALDWVEDNAEWIRYEYSDVIGNTNLALGTYGSSYGGGFQHTILSWDPKKRLDAMVPDITWHHLTYSFAPNLVLKTAWVTLLEAGGNAAGSGGNNADWIDQAFLEATTTNNVSQELIDNYFDKYGMNNYCAINRPHQVDALYTQGFPDVLFNLNEMYKNYQCVSALGGDVRLFTHQSGHILPGLQSGGAYACGDLGYNDAIFAWFEEKLMHKNGTADYLPEFCLSLADGESEHMSGVQIGSPDNSTFSFTVPNFIVGNAGPGAGNTPPTAVELGTADGTTMLAGIPEITVNMEIPTLGGDAVGDPRVFIGVGVQKGGVGDWQLIDDQVMPFRGYAEDIDQLVGVAERLEAGDKYGLLFYAWEQFFAGSASRDSEPAVDILVTVEMPIIPDPSAAP